MVYSEQSIASSKSDDWPNATRTDNPKKTETLTNTETLAETLARTETLAETLAKIKTLAETLVKTVTHAKTLANRKQQDTAGTSGEIQSTALAQLERATEEERRNGPTRARTMQTGTTRTRQYGKQSLTNNCHRH